MTKFCLQCGIGLGKPAKTGRPRKYCSDRHKVRAHRQRQQNSKEWECRYGADVNELLKSAGLVHLVPVLKEIFLQHGAGAGLMAVEAMVQAKG